MTRRWIPVHRGIYRISGCPVSKKLLLYAALLAAGKETLVCHGMASRLLGLDGFENSWCPEILISHHRKLKLAGVRVVRSRRIRSSDKSRVGAFPVTSVARTLLDMARELNESKLEEALDEALRKKLILVPYLARRIRKPLRGVTGVVLLRSLVRDRLGSRVSESVLETRFLRELRRVRLPLPVAQFRIPSALARVDFAYPRQRIAIELDGYAHHSSRRQWRFDLKRNNRLVAERWRVLRFTYEDVVHHFMSVRETIEDALAMTA